MEEENLGELLIEFFELYGRKFDYLNTGIYPKKNYFVISLIDLVIHYYALKIQWIQYENKVLDIKRAFDNAYISLSEAVSFTQNIINHCKNYCIL